MLNCCHRLGEDDPEDVLDRIYKDLRDDDARSLGRKYGLRYWVVPEIHASGLPTAYERDGYKVLDLR